ncbi:MAG: hypothetical protein N2482_02210 [Patescibacteria group bacterium]|nr:hypothetical protein [Patescibacteria group bacterium]
MVKNKLVFRKYFTLIETLIVVTIIITLSGLSLAYYHNFNEEKKLETNADKLIDALELAKKKANSSDYGNYSCLNYSGYRVSISSSQYILSLCCNSDCSSYINIANYNFSSNIQAVASYSVRFYPLNKFQSEIIQIKNTLLNRCINIDISSLGVITKGDKVAC